jgi:prepilin-type processing-associated H-X9-DG protein
MSHCRVPVKLACRVASPRRRAAFTLVELLVVMAVIIILASLLMPTVTSAMRSGSTSDCTNNLRQIHTGMMLYAQTFAQFIIPLGNYTTMYPHFDWWPIAMTPFLRDPRVYTCGANRNAIIGYGQNYRVIGGVDEMLSLFRYPQALTLVRKPSQSFIFCDGGYVANPDDPPNQWQQGIDPWTGQLTNYRGYARFPLDVLDHAGYYISYDTDPYRPLPRHPGYKTNCVFFDAHTETIPTWDLVDEEYGDPKCLYDNQ